MRFAVGYQLADPAEESFVDVVADYRDAIGEVYFPWSNQPAGRAALGQSRGYIDWSAQARQEKELRALKDMGVKLDLLFNANCYGGRAVSQALENQVISILDYLEDVVGGVEIVTTTSLAVARTVKREFPDVEVRASVNMRLGTSQAMEHVAGLFDSYHVQRDYHRRLDAPRVLESLPRSGDLESHTGSDLGSARRPPPLRGSLRRYQARHPPAFPPPHDHPCLRFTPPPGQPPGPLRALLFPRPRAVFYR